MTKGVSISQRIRNGWLFPESLIIDDFYNLEENAEYCLSSDGRYLIMTVKRKDGYGGKDLYVSSRTSNQSWTRPLNLGTVVNSADDETSPFLAADGLSLYFSSAGHPGYGSNDMFISRRLDDSWTNWSSPKNLGPDLNTEAWDAYYSLTASGEDAYFVSYQNRKSKADIYRAKLPQSIRPNPVVLVHGKVYNQKTGEKLGAHIEYDQLSGKADPGIANSDPRTGEYSITLPAGKEYGFLAKLKGFLSEAQNLDLTHIDEYQEIEQDLYLIPVEKGETLVLKNIFFEVSSARINQRSENELERIHDFLVENKSGMR